VLKHILRDALLLPGAALKEPEKQPKAAAPEL